MEFYVVAKATEFLQFEGKIAMNLKVLMGKLLIKAVLPNEAIKQLHYCNKLTNNRDTIELLNNVESFIYWFYDFAYVGCYAV